MKSNELRIGNYIYLPDETTHEIKEGSELDAIKVYDGIDYYKGIPITEEWLFKYNFKKHDNDYYSLDDSWIDFNDMGNWDFRVSYKYEFYVQIQHVHQLQNLYFALTGKELTL